MVVIAGCTYPVVILHVISFAASAQQQLRMTFHQCQQCEIICCLLNLTFVSVKGLMPPGLFQLKVAPPNAGYAQAGWQISILDWELRASRPTAS